MAAPAGVAQTTTVVTATAAAANVLPTKVAPGTGDRTSPIVISPTLASADGRSAFAPGGLGQRTPGASTLVPVAAFTTGKTAADILNANQAAEAKAVQLLVAKQSAAAAAAAMAAAHSANAQKDADLAAARS